MTATSVNSTEQTQWIRQAQEGDDAAFGHLVAAYQQQVYNLCYRMLGNARDAEDAAQETFLRAYKAIKRYDPRYKFSTWLLSIASHYCIDQYRRRRLVTVPLDGLFQPALSNPGPGPEQEIIQDEHSQHVRGLLDVLEPKDRAAVILRYWQELSYREIGEALSLTESAVKSRLHRARRALAHQWLEQSSPVAEKMETMP